MAEVYTVERIDTGVEVRLTRDHVARCRVWVHDQIVDDLIKCLTATREAELRANMPSEYDRVIARLIALIRAVHAGEPGGSIEAPPDMGTSFFPFLN